MTEAIVKKEHLLYLNDLRESGVTNMFDVGFICYATGLEKDKMLEIMRRWDELKELYKD